MLKLLAFAFINLLGAMSPGPDFAIVARYGITGSRKGALFATAGIAAALLIHVSYCLLGIAVFLKKSPSLFHAVQISGALYLGYLGLRLIFDRGNVMPKEEEHMIPKSAFFSGFLTNLLNPKAALFLLSLFTEFLTPDTPLFLKAAYGVTVPLIAFSWFALLSYLLTHHYVLARIQRLQKIFTFVMGCFLLLLSLLVFAEALGYIK